MEFDVVMSRPGATWRKPHWQTTKQRVNSHKNQRNRKMDDRMATMLPVGGMGYDELKHHVAKCRSKVSHKSRGAAYRAKLQAEEEHGVRQYIYECPICGKFHLTTHPWEGDE